MYEMMHSLFNLKKTHFEFLHFLYFRSQYYSKASGGCDRGWIQIERVRLLSARHFAAHRLELDETR